MASQGWPFKFPTCKIQKSTCIPRELTKDVISLLHELSDKYELIGYTDKLKKDFSLQYLGTDEEFIKTRKGSCGVVIPIDSSKAKIKLKNLYKKSNFFLKYYKKNAKINNLNINENRGCNNTRRRVYLF
jgi:hypothetical protein